MLVSELINNIRMQLNDIDVAEFTDDLILLAINDALDYINEIARNYGIGEDEIVENVSPSDNIPFNTYIYKNYFNSLVKYKLLEGIYDQDVALALKDMDYYHRHQLFKIAKYADKE
jgi:hypothetical protein